MLSSGDIEVDKTQTLLLSSVYPRLIWLFYQNIFLPLWFCAHSFLNLQGPLYISEHACLIHCSRLPWCLLHGASSNPLGHLPELITPCLNSHCSPCLLLWPFISVLAESHLDPCSFSVVEPDLPELWELVDLPSCPIGARWAESAYWMNEKEKNPSIKVRKCCLLFVAKFPLFLQEYN